ncbi:peptidoglycan-binding domain-containing protein [Salibaculum sp.]|uniref:peptidoglycan-binding domain-containing protein n=1 Tax=Salibaculum sp. TaxID=2855480 RepID=UPI002B480BE9|nr:peptidoglycan-binding domain-containing protein [Salibaculum sp.]HKL69052.1 peptidoglycan-binding domain-containing protein [Salibaculum sp.]
MRRLLLTTAFIAAPFLAQAEDASLILGIERYERLDRVSRADDMLNAQEGLRALGFAVQARANPRGGVAHDLAAAFAEDADAAKRLVVALAGHFVTDGSRSWLLTAEAQEPTLFGMGDQALSVDSLLQVLAARPGQAILLLAPGDARDLDTAGPVLRAGFGALDIPQGVTVLRGDPSDIADFMETDLVEPGADLAAAIGGRSDLVAHGFLMPGWSLIPAAVETSPEDPADTPDDDRLTAEAAAWDAAEADDNVEGYRRYIRAYPDGRFVDLAEERIRAILDEPNRDARLAEEALSLSVSARRAVQGDLTVLGYNTRGIDGIFGPGTRQAVTNWQQSNGYPQTSYLTRGQINRLDAQAERRRAENAAEEDRARAERERLDREYWSETGALGDEAGYRAYLNRYPEGLFADVAGRRLEAIEAERAEDAELADRSAWGIAAAEDTLAAYEDYLAAWPDGVFAEEARDRIARMEGPSVSDDQVATARAQEERLQLSGVRAQLLELRLRDLGLSPGPLDGVIDERTRRALRSYQEGQGIPPTGYVDQATLVRLMAGVTGR